MRWRLLLLPILAFAALAFQVLGGTAAPDPVNCTGYPEPRIYLENQSWWTPQFQNPANPTHPGTGQVGHIHVGMCFPLYQRISADSLHLDVTIKLHNMTGVPGRFIAGFYLDRSGPDLPVVPACETNDCTYTMSVNVPTTQLLYSGWREFQAYVVVFNADGTKQYNVPRWSVFVDRPLPPSPTVGVCPACVEPLGGDSWYRSGGSAYSRANVQRASIPWSETSGELEVVPTTWKPVVEFTTHGEFAYIDPAFHAVPPSKGTIVWEGENPGHGVHVKELEIDTTELTNGVHRLVVGSTLHSVASSVGPEGDNTGVIVIPFLVHNVVCT